MAFRTIAHITDAHLGQKLYFEDGSDGRKMTYINNQTEHQRNLLFIFEDLAHRGIKEMVFGGDIGTLQMNPWFFNAAHEHQLELQMVLGNHDRFSEVIKYFPQAYDIDFTLLNYIQEDDCIKYIFLDTSDNQVDQVRLSWLAKTMRTDKKIVLFMHHPVLGIDTPVDGLGAALKGRDDLKTLMQSFPQDITIFCGHYHMIDETIEGNICQFSTPAASYQIKKQVRDLQFDQNLFGYRIIEVNGEQLKTETILLSLR